MWTGLDDTIYQPHHCLLLTEMILIGVESGHCWLWTLVFYTKVVKQKCHFLDLNTKKTKYDKETQNVYFVITSGWLTRILYTRRRTLHTSTSTKSRYEKKEKYRKRWVAGSIMAEWLKRTQIHKMHKIQRINRKRQKIQKTLSGRVHYGGVVID